MPFLDSLAPLAEEPFVDFRLIEHLAGDQVAGWEFTISVKDALFREGCGNIAGSLDFDGLIATAMEDPYFDILKMGNIIDIGSTGQWYGSGKEIRPFIEEMPNPISPKGKSCEVDSLGVCRSRVLKKIIDQ